MGTLTGDVAHCIVLITSEDLNNTSLLQILQKNEKASLFLICENEESMDASLFNQALKFSFNFTRSSVSTLEAENLPQEVIGQLVDFIYIFSGTLSEIKDEDKITVFVAETSSDQDSSRLEGYPDQPARPVAWPDL